jgi:hypothetical protein
MSSLISCANCWYNPLQAGSLGSAFGYCVRHRVILRRPDETTCSLLTRKDLLLPSAQAEQQTHSELFGPETTLKVVSTREAADSALYQHETAGVLNGDRVVNLVAEYGDLDTKVESLAQLRATRGPRAEVAMLSLARGYTSRCVFRDGTWTSGLHLVWWTRTKLEEDPTPSITLEDLRFQLPVSLKRQLELVQWSLAMLRLSFISDIGYHAQPQKDSVGSLASLAEDAAAATGAVSLRKLLPWIKKTALPRFDKVLGYPRYQKLARELHR